MMMESINHPQEGDVILGGVSGLTSSAVLGGIAGVEWRLHRTLAHQPDDIGAKIAALEEAINYGKSGLRLLIQALADECWTVHQTAYSLLQTYPSDQVESVLIQYNAQLSQRLLNCYDAGERNFQHSLLKELCLQWAELSEANFREANLSQAYLNRADLSGVDFTQANLRGANLSEANLSEVNFTQAMISWGNLSGANLSSANLTQANLVKSTLIGADLRGANLKGAKLKGVDFSDANLSHAYYDDDTDFPIGFTDYDALIKQVR